MNFGMIVSYIIAGMLMIIIITIGYNTNYSGNELTLSENQKKRASEVVQSISYDLPKIGYNLNQMPDTMIRVAADNYIEFYANIDNSADQSLELVRWEFTTDSVTTTENPNDFTLRRTVGGTTTNMNAGVVSFEFRYYNQLGGSSPMATPITAAVSKSTIDTINQIEVVMVTESPFPLQYSSGSDPKYIQTSWTKRFSPVNLRDN